MDGIFLLLLLSALAWLVAVFLLDQTAQKTEEGDEKPLSKKTHFFVALLFMGAACWSTWWAIDNLNMQNLDWDSLWFIAWPPILAMNAWLHLKLARQAD